MSGLFYVYLDWTTEEVPRCFYVGKGNKVRVAKAKRNEKHTWVSRQHGMRREVVCSTVDESFAFKLEMELIQANDTYNPDHKDHSDIRCNKTLGGDGVTGHRFTSEQRAENKARWQNPKFRRMMSEKAVARNARPDYKAMLKKRQAERWKTDEVYLDKMRSVKHVVSEDTRAKLRKARANRPPVSEQTREKIRASSLGRRHTSETRERMRVACADRRFPQSDEIRAKLGAATKRRWQDPQYREKMVAMSRSLGTDEEYRNKLTEAQKARWAHMPPEQRERIREKLAGRKCSDESREKMRAAAFVRERAKRKSIWIEESLLP